MYVCLNDRNTQKKELKHEKNVFNCTFVYIALSYSIS